MTQSNLRNRKNPNQYSITIKLCVITPFVFHLEKMLNHLHEKSDNNAKIRSYAPIGIKLCILYKDICIIVNIQ